MLMKAARDAAELHASRGSWKLTARRMAFDYGRVGLAVEGKDFGLRCYGSWIVSDTDAGADADKRALLEVGIGAGNAAQKAPVTVAFDGPGGMRFVGQVRLR